MTLAPSRTIWKANFGILRDTDNKLKGERISRGLWRGFLSLRAKGMHIPGRGTMPLGESLVASLETAECMSGVSINFEMVKYAGFHIQYINVPLRDFSMVNLDKRCMDMIVI